MTSQGVSFYEFEDIADDKQFKILYRQRLNELILSESTAARIVDEANAAFAMNMKLFQELEGSVVKAIGRVPFNSLTRRRPDGGADLATAD